MTYLLIAINILVFITEIKMGGPSNTNVIINMGAKVNELIIAGEYWRLFTPMFLHLNYIHILANMISLRNTGPFVESVVGKINFLLIFIFSGIAGNLMSFIYSPNISAGASTSIFGIFGSIVVCGIFYRHNPQIKYAGKVMFRTIIVNLIYNLYMPYVDIYGHIGGALGGMLITTIMLTIQKQKRNKTRIKQV